MTLKNKYQEFFQNLEQYSMIFVHDKHGEKILDEYECPLQVLENFSEKLVINIKFWGKTVKNGAGNQILRYFEPQLNYAFFIAQTYFPPSAFTVNELPKDKYFHWFK